MQPAPAGEIRIDKEGCWFYNGSPIINEKILELFHASVEADGRGGYQLHIGAEIQPLVVEDTPYVVTHIEEDLQQGPGFFVLVLNDGSREQLCLESLYLSRDNIPYCSIKGGRFPARFLRAPYYELAQHIAQEGERFFILRSGKKHYIEFG